MHSMDGMTNILFHPVIGLRVYLAEHRASRSEVHDNRHFFSTDDVLFYIPFCDDFGPMNLYMVNRFCNILDQKLAEFPDLSIIYCVENSSRAIANGAFLLGCYMIMNMNLSPDAVWASFEDISDRIAQFRDATYEEPDFYLTLVDCWSGLSRATALGWVDIYDMDEYLHYDSPLEGDLHEVVPGKIVAFCGPRALPTPNGFLDKEGSRTFAPTFYLEPFGDMGVSTVVRLNEPEYDAADFADNGIELVDLPFEDCSAPPAPIVAAFMEVMRGAPGAVAVHCRAGLGRTGTLAAVYLMATHGFAAREAMGWLRIVRPGSVIGEQQRFLCDLEGLLSGLLAAGEHLDEGSDSDAEQGADSSPPPASGSAGDPPAPGAAGARRAAQARQVAAASGSSDRVRAALRQREAVAAAADASDDAPEAGSA
jgi:cell division cycle 14